MHIPTSSLRAGCEPVVGVAVLAEPRVPSAPPVGPGPSVRPRGALPASPPLARVPPVLPLGEPGRDHHVVLERRRVGVVAMGFEDPGSGPPFIDTNPAPSLNSAPPPGSGATRPLYRRPSWMKSIDRSTSSSPTMGSHSNEAHGTSDPRTGQRRSSVPRSSGRWGSRGARPPLPPAWTRHERSSEKDQQPRQQRGGDSTVLIRFQRFQRGSNAWRAAPRPSASRASTWTRCSALFSGTWIIPVGRMTPAI